MPYSEIRIKSAIIIFLSLVFQSKSYSEITKIEFEEVSQVLIKTYSTQNIIINNKQFGENFWWDQEQKYASYSKRTESSGKVVHFLFFFGGLARMPEMTPEGAALILCHELGHGIGGVPKKEGSESSVEGQADYFATHECLPQVLNALPAKREITDDPLGVCETNLCNRIFMGIRSELAVIQFNNPNQSADFNKIDKSVVEKVNTDPTYYPSNQCRLDTLVAGAINKDPPPCWWSPLNLGLGY